VRYEENQNADPLDCFKYLYAEPSAELEQQRKEFQTALEREGMLEKQAPRMAQQRS